MSKPEQSATARGQRPLVKYRVYEIVCRDKAIKDRYIGHTSMTKQVFIECQNGIVRDKVTGKKTDLGDKKQAPSRLQEFVMSHGGWGNWDFRVFPRLYESSHEAIFIKEWLIGKRPGVYTINIYKTGKKRAPRELKQYDFDSDEESVATDD